MTRGRRLRAAIIGASRDQMYALRTAQWLGIDTAIFTCNAEDVRRLSATGSLDAGQLHYVQYPELLPAAVQAAGLDFILPSCHAEHITMVGRANDRCQLPGVTEWQAEHCADKFLFDQVLADCGLPRPRLIHAPPQPAIADDVALIRAAADEIGYPCIVKPERGFGSIGVIRLTTNPTDAAAIDRHLAERAEVGGGTLIEEFVGNEEYGANVAVTDGEIVFCQFTRKHMWKNKETAHLVYPIDDRVHAELCTAVATIIAYLKLNDTFVNFDIRVQNTPDRVTAYVRDCSPRIGGMRISESLIPMTTGVDVIKQMTLHLSGADATFAIQRAKAGVLRMAFPHAGYFVRFHPGHWTGIHTRQAHLKAQNYDDARDRFFDVDISAFGGEVPELQNHHHARSRVLVCASGSNIVRADLRATEILADLKLTFLRANQPTDAEAFDAYLPGGRVTVSSDEIERGMVKTAFTALGEFTRRYQVFPQTTSLEYEGAEVLRQTQFFRATEPAYLAM